MVIFIVVILNVILVLHILMDIRIAYVHYRATKTKGIILNREGSTIVKNYGKFQFRKYWKYKVRYETPDGVFEDIIPISNANLKEGDYIDVKYTVNKTGTYLLDDVAIKRIAEFAVVLILGILLSAFIIMGKGIWVINHSMEDKSENRYHYNSCSIDCYNYFHTFQ